MRSSLEKTRFDGGEQEHFQLVMIAIRLVLVWKRCKHAVPLAGRCRLVLEVHGSKE